MASDTVTRQDGSTAVVLNGVGDYKTVTGGRLVAVLSSFTRPANTTAYTVGDVVSDSVTTTHLLAFPGAVRTQGGSGYVTGVRIKTNLASVTPQFRLFLYSASEATVTVAVDNAAATTLWANAAYDLGYIDLAALTGAVGSNDSSGSFTPVSPAVPVVAAAASTTLYGLLVLQSGALTPASGQVFNVTIYTDQN